MNTLQKYEKYLYIIVAIGVIIYLPIFFNGFVWDDYPFILNNPQVHQLNLLSLFGPSEFNGGPFYRPIPALYFAIVYSLSGNHAFLYHLLQLSLHLADTFLLFIFLAMFFTDGIAFFLAIIFLVHPINVESVAYIGSTQSELYFLPGIIALLLATKRTLSKANVLWIVGLLFLATITKETGFLFLLLVLAYRYIFKLGKLKVLLFSGAAIVAIYAICRVFVGGVKFDQATYIPIVTLPLASRLANIPAIIIYYLQTFIFPLNLATWQQWTNTNLTFQNFILPLITCLFLFALVCYFAFRLTKKTTQPMPVAHKDNKHNNPQLKTDKMLQQLIFFSFWYVIGMGLIMQIVPLDMTVADRWFYFPIVGLLGILGVMLQLLVPSIKQHHKLYLYGAIVLICILSLRTFLRTLDFRNNMTLYAHDLQTPADKNNLMVIDDYIGELRTAGRNDEALQYAEKGATLNNDTLGTRIVVYDYLGLLYQQKDGDNSRALGAFQKAVDLANRASPTDIQHSFVHVVYDNLAGAYLYENRYRDIVGLVNDQALQRSPDDPCLYAHLAIAQSALGHQQEALTAAAQAYNLAHIQDTVTIPPQDTLNKMCGFTYSGISQP
jgi:tetratricopeptide (TPR) repeat protein